MTRRTQTHTETVQSVVIDKRFVQCNICGREWETTSGPGQECIPIEWTGGYYSKFFGDCTIVQLDICEECMYDIVSHCEVPPQTKLGGILAHRDDGEWKPFKGDCQCQAD